MATKTELIEEAFSYIGILPEETGLSSAELIRGERELDKMAARWYDEGISMPYDYDSALGDDSGVTMGDQAAVSASLAIILHSIYANGKPLSESVKAQSRAGKKTIKAKYSVEPNPQYPPTLPRGAGSSSWSWRESTFFQDPNRNNLVSSNNDPILDDDGTPLQAE